MELAAIDILEFGTLNSAVRCDFSIAELQALHPPWPFYNPLPTKQFKKIFHEQNIKGDGNCLFRSVACALLGDENRYVETKQELLEWCRSNPRRTLELAKERCTFAEIEYILQTDRCWGDDVCVDIMQECFGIAIYSWIEPKRRADPYVVGLMPLPDLESPSHVIHLAFVNSNHFNLLIPFLASPTQHLSVEGDVQRDKSAKSSMMIGASMAVAGDKYRSMKGFSRDAPPEAFKTPSSIREQHQVEAELSPATSVSESSTTSADDLPSHISDESDTPMASVAMQWKLLFRKRLSPSAKGSDLPTAKRGRGRPKKIGVQETVTQSNDLAEKIVPKMSAFGDHHASKALTVHERMSILKSASEALLATPVGERNLKRTALTFGVPTSTLRRHFQQFNRGNAASVPGPGAGRRPVLPERIELELHRHICNMAEIGFACTAADIRILAVSLAQECGIQDFVASKGWFHRLRHRFPDLTRRSCQSFDMLRAGAMNFNRVDSYFELLGRCIGRVEELSGGQSLSADRVFNLDETGFSRDMRARWAIVPKRVRNCRHVTAITGGPHLTMVSLISAAGVACTPHFIVGAKRKPAMHEHKLTADGGLKRVSSTTTFSITESGYLTTEVWEQSVVPSICAEIQRCAVDKELWSLLILDGVGAHVMSHTALQMLWQSRIFVVKMPSHTSADLQPLDVCVFHPVKSGVSKVYRQELLKHGLSEGIDTWDIPSLVERAWFEYTNPRIITKSFQVCGIFPFDRRWASRPENMRKFLTSLPLIRDTQQLKARVCNSRGPVTESPQPVERASNAECDYEQKNEVFQRDHQLETDKSCSAPDLDANCNGICEGDTTDMSTPSPGSATSDLTHVESKMLGEQMLLDRAIELAQMNNIPVLCDRVLDDSEVLRSISQAAAQSLMVSEEEASMWLRWSAQVAGNIADNLRTPLLMSQVSNAQRRTKRRLNAIGESPSDAVAANEPERVQALKQENERRGVQKMAKQQRKDDKAKKFLREQAIARSLFDDGIIDWTPDAAQSVEICKQIIKPQLVEFVRKHNLEGLMRRETGENLYSIRRAVLVEFLLKHLPENAHHDGEEGDSGQLEDMSCLDFEEELNSTDSEPDEGSETASQISELSVNSVEASSDHGAAMLKTPETVVTVRLAGEPCESTDVESRFSGPLTWPQLCELMSSNGLQCEEPPNTVEHLINKTVCFKWQIGLEEVGAWCIGTITNTCTRLGYNYLVKYIGETYENYHLLTCDGYCFEEHAPIGAWFLLSK